MKLVRSPVVLQGLLVLPTRCAGLLITIDTSHHNCMAHRRALFFCESLIVLGGFMQKQTSDAHSNTYLISLIFDGISYREYTVLGI